MKQKTLVVVFEAGTVNLELMGIDIAELLVISKMCTSKTQARKAILQGAIAVNDIKIKSPFARILYDGEMTYILSETESKKEVS
jgi:tyrosyl-tRNA synthetase